MLVAAAVVPEMAEQAALVALVAAALVRLLTIQMEAPAQLTLAAAVVVHLSKLGQ